MSLIFHCSPQANNSQSINVFLCLPLALLPSIILVNTITSNWLFLMMCPTNQICLLTIIFRRFLDVLALWSTSSFGTLSVYAIRNIRHKNHISVASNCDCILWHKLIYYLHYRHNTDDHHIFTHACERPHSVHQLSLTSIQDRTTHCYFYPLYIAAA